MHIEALYIHPIKSLLPVRITASEITPLGLPHDRTFVLIRADTHEHLSIGKLSALCLFAVAVDGGTLTVTHTLTGAAVSLPLTPPAAALLPAIEVTLHASPCGGQPLRDGAPDAFFSAHLGFCARLLFLGGGASRAVLGNVAPPASWWAAAPRITFADCAPLLVVSAASVAAAAARVGGVDARAFRANVVVAPDAGEALPAFDEDYWAALRVAARVRLALTANCGRCVSVNVDVATGGALPAPQQPLRALAADRRVDRGLRFAPVFGRYAFLEGAPDAVREGDRVEVVRRNEERTVFGGWLPRCCRGVLMGQSGRGFRGRRERWDGRRDFNRRRCQRDGWPDKCDDYDNRRQDINRRRYQRDSWPINVMIVINRRQDINGQQDVN